MTSNSLRQEIRWAVEAAQDKQAVDMVENAVPDRASAPPIAEEPSAEIPREER